MTNEAEHVIEVEHLTKRYGGLLAVNGISFTVRKGEVFAFLGPNGAGKTTTVEIIETIRTPTSGNVRLLGMDVTKKKRDIVPRIGVLPQGFSSFDRITVRETLQYYSRLFRRGKTDIDGLIGLVNLKDKTREQYKNLSGGLKQRLGIAIALVNDPEVVFLDEPTTGLDPGARREVWDVLQGLKEKGKTVFLTTHYMEEAEICDRIAVMDNGALVALDTPAALKAGVGGDIVELSTTDNVAARAEIATRFGIDPSLSGNVLSLKTAGGGEFLVRLVKELTVPITNVNLRRPTLNDAFLALTGRQIREEEAPKNAGRHGRMRRGFH